MVYAFIIHTLFPGECKVLFHQIFSAIGHEHATEDEEDCSVLKAKRKEEIEYAAAQVMRCESRYHLCI